MNPIVGVSIVTYNHAATIAQTVQALRNLTSDLIRQVLITDNASTDGTATILDSIGDDLFRIHKNNSNTGFCEANNRAIATLLAAGCSEILILNPDVALEQGALEAMHTALNSDARIGMVTPKLLRAENNLQPISPAVIDAAGMTITPQIRHFDRGSQQPDAPEYDQPVYIFGGTGAALYLSEGFIRDAALRITPESIELFDPAFFAYREDADLSWRTQILGWRCRYEPAARAYHVRKVLPERRRELPPELNRLSVRNRFLLQLNNFSLLGQTAQLPPMLWRNLLVIGGVALTERSSLSALSEALRAIPSALRKHRHIATKRRVSRRAVARWFATNPVTEPVLESGQSTVSSVHVVVVNYNSGDRLVRCLTSLEQAISALQDTAQFSVTVVDNASADRSADTARALIAAHASWQLLNSRSNLGFAGGINAAARRVESDALLVLNPDVEVSADALRELVLTLRRYPTLSLLSPVLVSPAASGKLPTGGVQHGFTARRLPTVGSTIAELFFLHRLWRNNPWTEHYLYSADTVLRNYLDLVPAAGPSLRSDVPFIVEQPAGACFLVRTSDFAALQGFDEGFYPAWYEDVDFCKRLARLNKPAAVVSSARVVHEGGYSVATLSRADFSRIWFSNMLRYWRKHGGNGEQLVIRIALPFGLALRAMAATISSWRAPDQTAANTKRALASALLRLAGSTTRSLLHDVVGDLGDLLHAVQRLFPATTAGKLALPPQGEIASGTELELRADNWRRIFAAGLRGEGIEIGALHRPLEIHDKMRVRYVDRLSVEDLRRHYPELKDLPLVEPDIIDDGERLSTVAEDSQDFVIAAHLIEHTRNPIAAVLHWLRVLRPGGLLYLIVPDKRYIFDKHRVRTSLEHLVLDYESPSEERDFEHFIDYARHVSGLQGNQALVEAKSLADRDYSIHFHVFLPQDIVALLEWIAQNVTPLEILRGPAAAPGSDEFHLLIRKPLSLEAGLVDPRTGSDLCGGMQEGKS